MFKYLYREDLLIQISGAPGGNRTPIAGSEDQYFIP